MTRPDDDTGSSLDARAALARLTVIATQLGADRLCAGIDALRQRIDAGRFYLACVGEFKRGKSTLLNALVGQQVLPMGIVPVTTVPTVIQYGTDAAARITFTSGARTTVPLSDVERYVSEVHNPRNAQGVDVVEVLLPSAVLRGGLCLVDTPGLGSVFQENTAATRAFVPQIDAVLAVTGCDPPLSGDELELITSAARHVQHLIVVLNKADRFSDAERAEAARFAETALAGALGHPVDPILEVSATDRLAGRGPVRDWDRLVATLDTLAAASGRALVGQALSRGAERFIAAALREIGEAQAALHRPLQETETRLELLRKHVGDLAHGSLLFGFRTGHEETEAVARLAARRREFLERAVPTAERELADALAHRGAWFGPARRRQAMTLARAAAERTLAPWLAAECRWADDTYRALTARLADDARAMLARSPHLAALGIGDLSGELEPVESIRVPGAVAADAVPLPDPPPVSRLRWWADAAGFPMVIRRAIERDAMRCLRDRLATGSQAVGDDFQRRIGRSVEQLKADVYRVLATVYQTADRAALRAQRVQADGEDALRREAGRLTAMRQQVLALRHALAPAADA